MLQWSLWVCTYSNYISIDCKVQGFKPFEMFLTYSGVCVPTSFSFLFGFEGVSWIAPPSSKETTLTLLGAWIYYVPKTICHHFASSQITGKGSTKHIANIIMTSPTFPPQLPNYFFTLVDVWKVVMGARENGLRINDLTTYKTIKENYDIKLLLKSLSER